MDLTMIITSFDIILVILVMLSVYDLCELDQRFS